MRPLHPEALRIPETDLALPLVIQREHSLSPLCRQVSQDDCYPSFEITHRTLRSPAFSGDVAQCQVDVVLLPKSKISSNICLMGSPSSLSLTGPDATCNKDIYELKFCVTVDQRITWLYSEIGLLVLGFVSNEKHEATMSAGPYQNRRVSLSPCQLQFIRRRTPNI
jgi:hypothetical protein